MKKNERKKEKREGGRVTERERAHRMSWKEWEREIISRNR
jgi:hypothetical protein